MIAFAHRYRVLLALSATVSLVAACGDGPPAGPVSLAGNDPRIVVHDGESLPILDTSERIVLAYDEDSHCLLALVGNQAVVPIWPRGSRPTVTDVGPSVEVPGFGVITDGDSVTVHGAVSGALVGSGYEEVADCWPDGHDGIVIGSVLGSG